MIRRVVRFVCSVRSATYAPFAKYTHFIHRGVTGRSAVLRWCALQRDFCSPLLGSGGGSSKKATVVGQSRSRPRPAGKGMPLSEIAAAVSGSFIRAPLSHLPTNGSALVRLTPSPFLQNVVL